MNERTRRRLIISLPEHTYRALEARAAADERVAAQQAAHLLRQLLEGVNDGQTAHPPVCASGRP